MIQSTIDGMTFTTDSSTASIEILDGWYSAPPRRVRVQDNPNSDGASAVDKDYRSARVITQSGLLSATDADTAITTLWAQFASLQSDGVPTPFAVTDVHGSLSCVVSIETAEIGPEVNGLARYTLQMVARDPVKYGAPRTVSIGLPTSGGGLEFPLFDGGAGGALYFGANGNLGRVTLTNAGTATVWPTVQATGELTAGFYAQRLDTGQIVRYDRIVPAGSNVAVDFRDGSVLIDGVSDGSTYLTQYQFFAVAPGDSYDVQFNAIGGSAGTPLMDVTVSDGFW